MRRGCLDAGRKKRHDRRIIAADAVDAARARIVDFRHEVALAHAHFDLVEDALMHRFDDPRRVAHVLDLGLALDRALPVHQRRRVAETRIGQVFLQRGEGGCREPVVVHFDTDADRTKAAIGENAREIVHRVAFG